MKLAYHAYSHPQRSLVYQGQNVYEMERLDRLEKSLAVSIMAVCFNYNTARQLGKVSLFYAGYSCSLYAVPYDNSQMTYLLKHLCDT